MRNQTRVRWIAALSLILGAAAPVAVALPANADTGTTIEFVGETAVSAQFGGQWSLTVSLFGQQDPYGEYPSGGALGPKTGTVSVTVSGIGGTFSAGIPIQEDGRAYVTQPMNQPLLPAGEYQVTAIFTPAANTQWSTSQTGTPATLAISPLGLAAEAKILSDPTISQHPFIEASLSGEYVDTSGETPAGTWNFAVSDGDKEVFAEAVAQTAGSDGAIRVSIPVELRSGRELTLRTEFVPISEIAGGVVLSAIADSNYVTPGSGLLGSLSTQISFPIWATLALSALIVALVAVVIILGVRLSRRNSPARRDRPTASGDPASADIVDMEFVGIEPLRDGSPNWTLTDDDDDESGAEPTAAEAGAETAPKTRWTRRPRKPESQLPD